MFNPKVSIIIPVYNGSRYLGEAIDSALSQTYENIETIVINDGSADDGKSEDIARSYGDRIRYFTKDNGGVASALNKGIRHMAGEYFSWLSHDDLYCPDKLEKQVQHLRNREDRNCIVYSDFAWIDEHSCITGTFRVNPELAGNKYLSILATVMHGCSLLIPKACFDKAGLFNEQLRTTQDNEMWIRMAKAGCDFLHIPDILIHSRRHIEQGHLLLGDLNRAETKDFYLWAISTMAPELGESGLKAAEILVHLKQFEACSELLRKLGPPSTWKSLIKIHYIKTLLFLRRVAG